MRQDVMIATKLIEYISKDKQSKIILNGLNEAITKMIKEKEVISDLLLFIANILDSAALESNLNETVESVLKNIDQNERDIVWFKRLITSSNIWSLGPKKTKFFDGSQPKLNAYNSNSRDNSSNNNSNSNLETIDDNSESDMNRTTSVTFEIPALSNASEMNKTMSYGTYLKSPKKGVTFFDKMKQKVLQLELERLESEIHEEIDKTKGKSEAFWNELMTMQNFNGCDSEIIRQDRAKSRFRDATGKECDIMEKNGCKAEYPQSTLFTDAMSGFNGSDSYDYDCYLSKLLIQAHRINPHFQESCVKILKRITTECEFSEVFVKSKASAIIKSITRYKDRKWPLTANLLGMSLFFFILFVYLPFL